jgi:hypothetical protein
MRKTDPYFLCKRAAKAASVHFRHRKRLQWSSRAVHCAHPVTSRAMDLFTHVGHGIKGIAHVCGEEHCKTMFGNNIIATVAKQSK